MRAVLHVAGCLAVLPYLALAGFFLFVDRAAATKGLPELFEFVLAVALAVLDGEGFLAVALWGLVVALGVLPATQRYASGALGFAAIATLLIILTIHAGPLEPGQILFLAPCGMIALLAAWLMSRPLPATDRSSGLH